ncbi:MAG: bacteriohemerythrin, partial [Desulfovibrionaceae bacterium]
ELIRAVFELRLYAFHHFHTEETLMVKYGYPRCLQHFREHDAYLKRLREVVGEVESLPGEKAPQADQSLRDLANKLSEWAVFWWSEHILSHDQQYAGHIKKVKKRKE